MFKSVILFLMNVKEFDECIIFFGFGEVVRTWREKFMVKMFDIVSWMGYSLTCLLAKLRFAMEVLS